MTGLPHVAVRHHAVLLIGCLIISALPGVVGSQFQPGEWYAGIEKSPLTPPGWVFPVVWTSLYAMIGIALYVFLVHAPERARRPALVVFGIQLALNAAWSWLFFGLHTTGLALVEIVVLWLSIVATIVLFRRHSRGAALLLAPYAVWVGFASYLNFAIWYAN